MTQPPSQRLARWLLPAVSWLLPAISWLLPAIILTYLVLGTLYALFTPAWQAPDEPAHYNYVRYLAEQHAFPILKAGDYPAAYLEEIKAARFPPEMSIEPIRYEFHQPPLYYVLAVPFYSLFGGALLPLRLLSVAIGALLLLVIYWTVQELAPEQPLLALGATAFVALLPMHLAMTAAANNDTLTELILATILLLTIRYLKRPAAETGDGGDTRLLVLLGITTGLGLVAKSPAYIALPLVLVAIFLRHVWLDEPPPPATTTFKSMGIYLLPALLMALPWWLRNIAIYGGLDFLGLQRHGEVVAGQLRTAEFIAANGLPKLITGFFLTSFRSFWGQFGWMGVLLDSRIYQALAIFSAIALVGFLLWAARAWRDRASYHDWQWAAGGLLALSAAFTLASYLWYNLDFLQHQGRYLFPALLPLGLAVALGWREALRRGRALLFAALALVAVAGLAVAGALSTWTLLMLGATAVAFALRRFLPRSLDTAVNALPYLLLIPLDLACLFLFIVPQLSV